EGGDESRGKGEITARGNDRNLLHHPQPLAGVDVALLNEVQEAVELVHLRLAVERGHDDIEEELACFSQDHASPTIFMYACTSGRAATLGGSGLPDSILP